MVVALGTRGGRRPRTIRPMPILCPACRRENPDGMKFCGECGARLVTAAAERSESRKLVTILFADVTGSTALGERLDPEALRTLMGRYFATMRRIIEAHGGTVEKFIGDAVMAVFGIPQLHEDDALRACRAAMEIRDALAALNAELETDRGFGIRFRTGVNTGEVVVGDPGSGTTLVTGDTVNTAARLEQAATPGEVLIGNVTFSLVRDAVEVEAIEPVQAKGKAEPLTAYRLVAVRTGAAGRARHLGAPLVGRERELGRLEQAFRQAIDDRACQLFTVLGLAGVGKSRLVAEFLTSVESEARILRGRCLSYGEGVTFWPVREIVHTAAGIDEADGAEEARSKVRTLYGEAPDGEALAAIVNGALGLSAELVPHEDLFWAVRRLFEALAEERPLVVVVEDIHWAEPTMLELLEHVADWSRDAPLLLLCPARPELLESRPAWGGGKLNATTILLEPLGPGATERLIEQLPGGSGLPPRLVEKIANAADGNPLYLEELLAMLVDDGVLRPNADGTWVAGADVDEVRVPPSISALLTARLDRLTAAERAVAQRASIVGRVFDRLAVTELSPDEARPEVQPALQQLMRKELIRPERSADRAVDAFKFRHLLIRDAAYEALPKGERARLHLRFADWLEATAGDRLTELEEIVGYHLEQAHRYRTQLGESPDSVRSIADRAAARLERAGERAYLADDHVTASGLLLRARALASEPASRGRIGALAATSLFRQQRVHECITVGEEAVADARAAGDKRASTNAWLTVIGARFSRSEVEVPALWVEVANAEAVFTELGDELGLARTGLIRSFLASAEGREDDSIAASREAARHAEAAGDLGKLAQSVGHIADSYVFGRYPVGPAIEELERALPRTRAFIDGWFLAAGALAILHAMAGHRERALELLHERESVVQERRGRSRDLANRQVDGMTAMLLEEPSIGIEPLRTSFEDALAAGDLPVATATGCVLAELHLDSGAPDAARAIAASLPEAHVDADSAAVQMLQSRLALANGDIVGATTLALAAIETVERTEWLAGHGLAWARLAEVRLAGGDAAGASDAARTALERYEAKGDVTSTTKVRRFLEGVVPVS
jgi:class 3 adenylate cyclase